MADQSDVEAALAGAVGAALYPAGVTGGCVAPGAIARVFRGAPTPAALEADMAAGRCQVSILAHGEAADTTRWPEEDAALPAAAPTLTAQVDGATVTFGGAAGPGQVAAVIADGLSAAYRTQPGDTPPKVAAALARLMGVTGSGASVLLPGVRRLAARVEADQPTLRLTRRQEQRFRVTCWCPSPRLRDALGAAIDAALSGIGFLGLADGTSGRLRFAGSGVSDAWEGAALFRRELTYAVDYPTTIAATLPRMAIGVSSLGPDAGAAATRLS